MFENVAQERYKYQPRNFFLLKLHYFPRNLFYLNFVYFRVDVQCLLRSGQYFTISLKTVSAFNSIEIK